MFLFAKTSTYFVGTFCVLATCLHTSEWLVVAAAFTTVYTGDKRSFSHRLAFNFF